MDDKFIAIQFQFNGVVAGLSCIFPGNSVSGNSIGEIEHKIKTTVPVDFNYWLVFEPHENIYTPIMFLNTKNKDDIIKHDLNKHC